MKEFPHQNIDLKRLQQRLCNEIGLDPLGNLFLQDMINLVLTSIPDDENIIVSDPVTDEPVGRYVFIPLFSNS